MKRGKMILIPLGLFLAVGAQGVVTEIKDNPYKSIFELNGFRLRPPDPPPPPPTNAPPQSNVKIAGITTILSTKRVIFQVVEGGKTVSKMLSEGQRDGGIEVLEGGIDENKGSVAILNGGIQSVLTLEKDGLSIPKVSMAPTPGVVPNPNPAGGSGVPPPFTTTTSATTSTSPNTGGRTALMSGGTPAPTTMVAPAAVIQNLGNRSIPSRTLRLAPVTQATVMEREKKASDEKSAMTNIVIMEVVRQQTKHDKTLPPIPDTPLTPPEDSTTTKTAAPAPPPIPAQ